MNGVPLLGYLVLGLLMFCIGAVGVIIRRSPVVIFMCIELMLNAANLTFLSFARYLPAPVPPTAAHSSQMSGQMMVIFVMAVAAAEVAVGLGIIMAIFRTRDQVDVDDLSEMEG